MKVVLPASAGMILADDTQNKARICAPRIRGDDPDGVLGNYENR